MKSDSIGHMTRRNPFRAETTEAQWVRFQAEQGTPKEEIIKNALAIGCFGKDEELTTLVVEYQLGERSYADIEHLLTPNLPTEFVFIGDTEDGYLCEVHGDAHSNFHVLVKAATTADALKTAIENHQAEFCFYAFKNAHEGYPFGYSLNGVNGVAKAGISHTDIAAYLP